MRVAIITVGDELLAGDTADTNAAWLASRLTERGASVGRILTVPDDRGVIADWVGRWAEAFDAVVVTGGIGGTPDDVTVEGVADGLGRDMAVHEGQRERLLDRARRFREANPDLAEAYDFDVDLDAAASLPAGARPLATEEGWAPGCVVENVYVLPGIPAEMRAMFDLVAGEFGGDNLAETLHTPAPEGALGDVLAGVRERFDVSVGSYPRKDDAPGRIRVAGTDADEVAAAVDWVRGRVEVVEGVGENHDPDPDDP